MSGRKTWMCKRNIYPLLLTRPLLGTWPATQACARTGNRTSNPLVHKLAFNPLSHSSQGYMYNLDIGFHIIKKKITYRKQLLEKESPSKSQKSLEKKSILQWVIAFHCETRCTCVMGLPGHFHYNSIKITTFCFLGGGEEKMKGVKYQNTAFLSGFKSCCGFLSF